MTSTPSCPDRSSSALALFVAAAVAIAFADSSVVVLALPQLYVQFHTTIEGVAWVVTTYNAAVAQANKRDYKGAIVRLEELLKETKFSDIADQAKTLLNHLRRDAANPRLRK